MVFYIKQFLSYFLAKLGNRVTRYNILLYCIFHFLPTVARPTIFGALFPTTSVLEFSNLCQKNCHF